MKLHTSAKLCRARVKTKATKSYKLKAVYPLKIRKSKKCIAKFVGMVYPGVMLLK